MKRNPRYSVEEIQRMFSYDPVSGIVRWRIRPAYRVRIGDEAGHQHHTGYRLVGKYGSAHVIAWVIMSGEYPVHEVDHRNTVKNDNRWENLRLAPDGGNKMNVAVRADNTSGIKGVHYQTTGRGTKRWQANISKAGKLKFLGRFKTREEAAEAYARAAHELHGEFARLA
jgi:hypothetical protein